MIDIQGLSKSFGEEEAVQNVDLTIHRGEIFSLLGPSGCGKTTLLRLIAGFEQADTGHILVDGRSMDGVPPWTRPVNMMFQAYALFPHMSVADNVAFGLKRAGMAKQAIEQRVDELLHLVEMTRFKQRRPHQLSGGQQQRVALVRSLARQPKVLLLDEPLGALDRALREKTQLELTSIQARLGVTFVIVTHDQEEAMAMSTRVAVMDKGRVLQIGTPASIYETPNSRTVAGFLGRVNIFPAQLEHAFKGARTPPEKTTPVRVRLTSTVAPRLCFESSRELQFDSVASVAIRPENIFLSGTKRTDKTTAVASGRKASAAAAAPTGERANHFIGTIVKALYSGATVSYLVAVDGMPEPVYVSRPAYEDASGLQQGAEVRASFDKSHVMMLPD